MALREAKHRVWSVARGEYPGPAPDLRCDRLDQARLKGLLERLQPEVIIDHVGYTRAEVQILLDSLPQSTRRLLFVSSAIVYGLRRSRAYTEAEQTYPQGAFAEEKHAAERLIQEAPIPSLILRLGALYGPGHAPLTPWGRDPGLPDRIRAGEPLGVPEMDLPGIQPLFSGDHGRVVAALMEWSEWPPLLNLTGPEMLNWGGLFGVWAEALSCPTPPLIPRPTIELMAALPEYLAPFILGIFRPPTLNDDLLRQALKERAAWTSCLEGFKRLLRS